MKMPANMGRITSARVSRIFKYGTCRVVVSSLNVLPRVNIHRGMNAGGE